DAGDVVADLVELSLDGLVDDLEVRHRRAATRTPVHDVAAPVDQARLVHRHEGVAYGPREVRVHREPLARPVERAPEALQLRLDRVLGLALPGPDALDELLAAERLAVDAFLRELALDDHLGRDPGVVGPRHPEDAVAQHALPPGQHVLDRAPV